MYEIKNSHPFKGGVADASADGGGCFLLNF